MPFSGCGCIGCRLLPVLLFPRVVLDVMFRLRLHQSLFAICLTLRDVTSASLGNRRIGIGEAGGGVNFTCTTDHFLGGLALRENG